MLENSRLQSPVLEPPMLGAPAMDAVGAVFQSLGRGVLCLDSEFRVVHAGGLSPILGAGADRRVAGRSAEELLGDELFGAGVALRRALEKGERREGWGASLSLPPGLPRRISLAAAPLQPDLSGACDPRVRYLLVVGPADDDLAVAGAGAPMLFDGMLARSPAARAMVHLIESLEESEATVLLTGGSGTDMERVARAIHLCSPRRKGPFVAVNCGAIPAEQMESELLGHARGAVTGAASEGTIFLDEVADLPPPLQAKLLRVLQERTFEPAGESRPRRSEARVIATTRHDLERLVAAGGFRGDLYDSLRRVTIEVPEGAHLPGRDAGERERLRHALDAHRWRREETARTLGMSRTTLWRKMRELGLARPRA